METSIEVETQIKILEKELSEIKNKKKDLWDVIQILGGLLVPVAIAFAGFLVIVKRILVII